MPDASLLWDTDFSAGPTGDLATVSGTDLGQQRVLRRLLTNPGDYIWQPSYGAGLGQLVGQPIDVLSITSLIRSQIFQESCVTRTPEPVVDVSSDGSGAVFVDIRYIDNDTGSTQLLSFSVSA
jgi:phage baseplate assembly protein W